MHDPRPPLPASGDAAAADPTPQLTAMLQAQPDLVDRIFDYLLENVPALRAAAAKSLSEMKSAVRSEFGNQEVWIAKKSVEDRRRVASEVLAHFNGRNASEVARKLNVSRATVYRHLKQARRAPRPDSPGGRQ